MNLRTLMRITIGINLVFLVFVVVAYIINFRGMSISSQTQDWGTFGDYFGGILNPIIGIMNLVLLVYITFLISDTEESRSQNELNNQKKFALYSLKHDSLKELNTILEKVQPEIVKSESDSSIKLIFIRNDLNAFIITNTYLFPSFENDIHKPLAESIMALSQISQKYYESKHTLDIDTEVKPELQRFSDLKVNFILKVQKEII